MKNRPGSIDGGRRHMKVPWQRIFQSIRSYKSVYNYSKLLTDRTNNPQTKLFFKPQKEIIYS